MPSKDIGSDETEARLEKARADLLATLAALRRETLSTKEADAVEAAIEDELIALRVGLLCGRWLLSLASIPDSELPRSSDVPCYEAHQGEIQ